MVFALCSHDVIYELSVMDITYENGCIIVIHDSGIVIKCNADEFSAYLDHKVLRLDELQIEIDKDRAILDLIEASEN